MGLRIPDNLLHGYQRFRSGRYTEEAARYRALAVGQTPRTMIIACADSRVDPATIFAAGPGELFVVRNVAAIVPPCDMDGGYHGTSAAIEFAVTALKVQTITVMGHGQCGGIAAALAAGEDRPVGQFIGPWVSLLDKIRDELLLRSPPCHPAQLHKTLERLAIRQSIENLLTFPFVSRAVEAHRLVIEGAWFSIGEGELHWLDQDSDTFETVPDRT